MTQPTQAQIEAAAKAMFKVESETRRWVTEWGDCRELARIALTAAAEAGKQTNTQWINETMSQYGCGGDPSIHKMMAVAIAATIERCAQVADEFTKKGTVGLSTPAAIAAAIRVLKEQQL